jgi:hypothetical protein
MCSIIFSPVMGYYSNKISNVAHCHFDSLNLARISNLEFEFMRTIQATERAQLKRPGPIIGFYQLVLGQGQT